MHGGADVGAQPGVDLRIALRRPGPGQSSRATSSEAGAVAKKRRTNLTMSRRPSRSASACSRLSWILGLSRGSAERSDTLPRLCGCSSTQELDSVCPTPLRQPGNHGRAKIDTGRHQHLQVGPVEMRRGAHQALRGNRRAREDAVAEHLPLQHRQGQPVEAQLAVEAEFAAGGVVHAQWTGDPAGSRPRPAAHAARRMPCGSRSLGRTDARELQQLRRIERAGGQDHLALAAQLPNLAAATRRARRRSGRSRAAARARRC